MVLDKAHFLVLAVGQVEQDLPTVDKLFRDRARQLTASQNANGLKVQPSNRVPLAVNFCLVEVYSVNFLK